MEVTETVHWTVGETPPLTLGLNDILQLLSVLDYGQYIPTNSGV